MERKVLFESDMLLRRVTKTRALVDNSILIDCIAMSVWDRARHQDCEVRD